jgi:transposase
MAGAFHDGGRRRADTRQDAQAWQTTAIDRHRAEGGRSRAWTAAGRRNPLDRPDVGEGGGGKSAFGATYSRGPPTRAASHPHVKLSTDPKFADKLKDVAGLYVDPPAHAVVLSVDEKSQIQALDRTQPGLPMKPGRAGTMTHDYKRHGTTTLFAALNILDGTVIGRNMQRHRHQEFIRFLTTIEQQVPVGKLIHAIVDNYATHKHPKVHQWLARHPRWTFHFTPTSASWLNAVEGFFAKLTRRRLKRGVFRSVVDLQVAINRFVAETNADPKPFVWTADPKRVLAAVKRGKQTLESIH